MSIIYINERTRYSDMSKYDKPDDAAPEVAAASRLDAYYRVCHASIGPHCPPIFSIQGLEFLFNEPLQKALLRVPFPDCVRSPHPRQN